MDELGAELDWDGSGAIAMREDSAADAFARFEHDDVDVEVVESSGGGEAGGSRSDDDDVGFAHVREAGSGKREAGSGKRERQTAGGKFCSNEREQRLGSPSGAVNRLH